MMSVARGESSVRFVHARSGREARAFDQTTILASSAELSWPPGLLVETGRNDDWCVSEVFVAEAADSWMTAV